MSGWNWYLTGVDLINCLLNNCQLERVHEFKYLGIKIDDKLKFQGHIDYLSSKVSSICGSSYRLGNLLNLRTAKNFYYSCLYSIVTYCICVCGGVLQCTQRGRSLNRLYEKTVRNLFKRFCSQGSCIFKEVGILKLDDVHRLYVGAYMFKVLKMNLYPSLQVNLDLKYPDHDHNTRAGNDPRIPFPRVSALRINFKYQCVKIWNELPHYIKDARNLGHFKKTLLEYFLERY